jgi:hypothetical protein
MRRDAQFDPVRKENFAICDIFTFGRLDEGLAAP